MSSPSATNYWPFIRHCVSFKYNCRDEDARELAASPIINQLLVENNLALRPFLEKSGITDEARLGWGKIEGFPDAIETVKAHLSHVDNWHDLSEWTKKEVIKDFLQPLSYEENTVQELLQGRNNS